MIRPLTASRLRWISLVTLLMTGFPCPLSVWSVDKTDSLAQRALSDNDQIRQSAFREIQALTESKKEMTLLDDMITVVPSNEPGAKRLVAAARQLPDLKNFTLDIYARTAEALNDSHERNTPWSVLTSLITSIGPEALPIALRNLESKNEKDRESAATILGFIATEKVNHPAFESALPNLIHALADSNDSVCSPIAETLGRLGTQAKSAMPRLMELAREWANNDGRTCPSWATTAVLDIAPKHSKENQEAGEIASRNSD